MAALYALLVSLGATKMVAEQAMQDFPRHGRACQAIVDFASDGEGDIRGAIVALGDEEAPWRRERGGAVKPEISLPVQYPTLVLVPVASPG